MSDPSDRPNVFFPLVTVAAGAFTVTVFALTATVLGGSESPLARFLDQHAGTLLAAEVAAILVFGFCAMAVDRIRTRRNPTQRQDAGSPPDAAAARPLPSAETDESLEPLNHDPAVSRTD